MKTKEQKVDWEEILNRTNYEGWDSDPKNVKAVQSLYSRIDNDDKSKKEYSARSKPISVQFRNGESQTYKSKTAACEILKINFYTLKEYLDTGNPVKSGKSKAQGCYFYSLPKEDTE